MKREKERERKRI